MNIKAVHEAIGEAMNTIYTKGGQSLYDGYIAQKIPNDVHQNCQNYLYTTINGAYLNHSDSNKLKKDYRPKNIGMDRITPCKVQRRPRSQCGRQKIKLQAQTKLNKTNDQIDKPIQNKNSILYPPKIKINSNNNQQFVRPKFSIKYSCQKQDGYDLTQQKTIRIKKAQQNKQKQRKLAEEEKYIDEKNYRRSKLQRRIEELAGLGIGYGFGDDGQLITPDEKQIKLMKRHSEQKKNIDKNLQGQKILNLKFKTLDVMVNRYNPQDIRLAKGKKKGFIASSFYKKLRMTDKQFNNQNSRQCTTIPFLNLSSGITLIQKEKNVKASRSKEPCKNRDEFIEQTKTCSFKSYMPERDERLAFSLKTVSVDRPFTTAGCERTKRTAETKSVNTSRARSILWRPQTTSQTCRMSVNNMDLVRQFVRE